MKLKFIYWIKNWLKEFVNYFVYGLEFVCFIVIVCYKFDENNIILFDIECILSRLGIVNWN